MPIKFISCAALLFLTLFACSQVKTDHIQEADALTSGVLIESPALWEALEKGTENSPEIKYARRVGAKIETGYLAELAQAGEKNTPPSKCNKLPAVQVVVGEDGKIAKAVNLGRSCWVSGTRMAVKASKEIQLDAPPKALLKNGSFKFSWTPELPEIKRTENN